MKAKKKIEEPFKDSLTQFMEFIEHEYKSKKNKSKKFWQSKLSKLIKQKKWNSLGLYSNICSVDYPNWEYVHFCKAVSHSNGRFLDRAFYFFNNDSKLISKLRDEDEECHDIERTTSEEYLDICYSEHSCDPKTVISDAHFCRGVRHAWSYNYKEAAKNFRIVLEYDNKHDDAYYCLGDVLGKMYDYQGAIENLTQAIKIAPNAFIYYSLRCHYFNLAGYKNEAIWDKFRMYLLENEETLYGHLFKEFPLDEVMAN